MENITIGRDKTIDRLRCFAILWVIVVHVLYMGGFFTNRYVNLVKSFLLFEMPLFFFITGASNSFSKTGRYFDFVGKRFQRILIPYWVFSLICAGLSIAQYNSEGVLTPVFALKVLLSWLIPINRQMSSIPSIHAALWFIPVYLCIVLLLPLLKRVQRSARRKEFFLLLTALFFASCLLKAGRLQKVFFYTFWTYAGLFYRDIRTALGKKPVRRCFLYAALGGAAAVCLLHFAGQTVNMQINKFPPNMMFFAYSITAMSLIIWAIPYFDSVFSRLEACKPIGRLIDLFATRSMTIFLYQIFAFYLTVALSHRLIPGNGFLISVEKAVLCLTATIPVCALLAMIFGKIEDLRIGHK